MLQRLCLTRSHPSIEEKTLINMESHKFIAISVQDEDAICRCCSKEVSELSQYEEENEQN